MNKREIEILDFLQKNPGSSSKEIHDHLTSGVSYATVKRSLAQLASEKLLNVKGQGRGTRYLVSPAFELLQSIDIDQYYRKEIDERIIIADFNFGVFELLAENAILNERELQLLPDLFPHGGFH